MAADELDEPALLTGRRLGGLPGNGKLGSFSRSRPAPQVTLAGVARRTIGIRAVPEFMCPLEGSEMGRFLGENAPQPYWYRGAAILEPL